MIRGLIVRDEGMEWRVGVIRKAMEDPEKKWGPDLPGNATINRGASSTQGND